jgi:hypothetical protein
MVQELSYNVTSHVIESWEKIRRIKNYEEVAGVVLFQRCVRVIVRCRRVLINRASSAFCSQILTLSFPFISLLQSF